MPRRNRNSPPPERAARPGAAERREVWRGEDYAVRTVPGAAATKSYRCPGCDQEIPPGRPHLVTWPAVDATADDRRHWHTACWHARERRGPGTRR